MLHEYVDRFLAVSASGVGKRYLNPPSLILGSGCQGGESVLPIGQRVVDQPDSGSRKSEPRNDAIDGVLVCKYLFTEVPSDGAPHL